VRLDCEFIEAMIEKIEQSEALRAATYAKAG
jgi:hypothetical protein